MNATNRARGASADALRNRDARLQPGIGEEQETIHASDCAAQTEVEQGRHLANKHFYTFRARLALAGYALMRTAVADGPQIFFASRWGITREMHDLTAVQLFVDGVGASPTTATNALATQPRSTGTTASKPLLNIAGGQQ